MIFRQLTLLMWVFALLSAAALAAPGLSPGEAASWIDLELSVSPPIRNELGRDLPVEVRIKDGESFFEKNLLSIVAILVSVGSLYYTFRTTAQARLRSVRDDFWIRQVAYPTVIEPCLALVTHTAERIGHIEPSDAGVELFRGEFVAQLRTARAKLALVPVALGQGDVKEVYESMQEALEALEDCVTGYCLEVKTAIASNHPVPPSGAAQQATLGCLAKLVTPLRTWQSSL